MKGVQQDDHLSSCTQLSIVFCVMYLDYITLGGTTEAILHDIGVITSTRGDRVMLEQPKSEIICVDSVTRGIILVALLRAKVLDPSETYLLGSTLGDADSLAVALKVRLKSLKVMGNRLPHFTAHDALLLLWNSFLIPKVLYLLLISPCFCSSIITSYDECLKSLVSSSITGVHFTADQTTLSVRYGGIRIHFAGKLAPSAYLASAAASSQLIHLILPTRLRSQPFPELEAALSLWTQGHDHPPPLGKTISIQKMWNTLVRRTILLLENAANDMVYAQLQQMSLVCGYMLSPISSWD